MTPPSGTNDDNTSELPIIGTASVPEPAPAQAQAGWQPALVSPPRRSSVLLFIGMTAAGVVLLAVGMLVGFSLNQGGPNAAVPSAPAVQRDSPRVVTERYLSAVVNGDQAGVNADTCALLRGGQGTQDRSSAGNPWQLGGLVGFGVGNEQINGRAASVDVDLRVPIVGTLKFGVKLVVEEGVWRVCGFSGR